MIFGAPQLFHQGLYRGSVSRLRLQGQRLELQVLDAPAEAGDVLFLCLPRQEQPKHAVGQAEKTKLKPGHSKDFQRDQEHHRTDALSNEPVGRDVDEGLGLELDLFGKGLEKNFPGRLVETVTQLRVRDTS